MRSRVQRLRRLAEIRALSERDAARGVAAATAEAARAQQALDLIERYANEYAGVPEAAHSGLRLRQQAEMHSRLREAAAQQQGALAAAERRIDDARVAYQSAMRARRSIEAVAERRARDAALSEARHEQRTSDEWAAFSARNRVLRRP